MIESIHNFIEKHLLIENYNTIIVGFSGGPDSLFLLHCLAQMRAAKNLTLIAAHLDHEWRENSHDEAVFCHTIAESLEIPFVAARMSELYFDKKSSGSQEELGRRARRFFLESVLAEHNADAIALAHHLNDQEETFLIRLIRGATIAGLASMKPHDGRYIRPLLEIQKKDIIAYLEKNGIDYITDPTNTSESYLRSRIRTHVIPALRYCDDRFDANFQKTLQHIQEADSFLDIVTEDVFTQTATLQENIWYLSLATFLMLHPFLQQRILIHWLIISKVSFVPSQRFLNEIMRFLQQPGSKEHTIHTTWSIIKKKNIAHIKHI